MYKICPNGVLCLVLTWQWSLVLLSQPTVCCIESNLSPTHSTWAIGYNGTMYSAGFSGRSSFNWRLYFSKKLNDSAEYQWCQVESICGEPHYDTTPFNSPLIFSTVNTSLADYTKTTFGSMVPLNQTFNNSMLELIREGNRCDPKNIIVTECLDSSKDGVGILYNDEPIYNTKGAFYCLNNGILFDENGKEQTNNETRCLSDATWEGQDGLQCWKAPLVTLYVLEEIKGTIEVSKNSKIQLNCSYAETTPVAKSNRYYLGDILLNETLPHTALWYHVKREDDKKSIYCQAITPFTEIYVETGKSENLILNVLYQPYETSISADTSTSIVMTDSGLLLNSTQTVTIHCTSDSNPKANCSFDAPFTTWGESCSINRDFTTSGSVSCSTNNGIGNTGKSQTLSVVVVEQRTSDVILTLTDEGSIKSGYDVTLNCSVPYQDELNTIFEWTIPSDRTIDVTDSILTLNNLTRFDRGNYICQTKDDFGKSMKSLFLDVLYGASQDPGSKTACTWSEVANNSCFLNFNSNPPTKDYLLTRGDTGEDATCQNCHFETIGSKNITQRFIFALSQTSNEAANFNLRILSSGFPDLVVTLAISDVVPIDSGDDQTVVIIASVIGGIVFIAIILAALFVIKKKGFFDKKEKQLSVTTSNKNQHVDDGGYEQFQQPAKNLNIDQGTAQTTGHYMNVAFRQTDGHEYDTDIPSANGTYEVPLNEEHKYAEIRNRKGSYETTILP